MLDLWNRTEAVVAGRPTDGQIGKWLKELAPIGTGALRTDEQEHLLEQPIDLVWHTIEEILTYRPPADMHEILQEEFRAIEHGAAVGIPPGGTGRSGKYYMEINPAQSRVLEGPGSGMSLVVAPVDRLSTVVVQTGYRRAVGNARSGQLGEFVSAGSPGNGKEVWLPGYEAMGEGIFISLADGAWHPQMAGAEQWMQAWAGAGTDSSLTQMTIHGRHSMHPVFVWWHTLSHLLIRALSVESGYSVAAIRERIYIRLDENGTKARGGVLLYAAGAGSDGSLGGLIALVPKFEQILEAAAEMAITCSADPLCQEHEFRPGMQSGAACYACSLISETSCEHRNLWLDRNLLRHNLP